VFDRDCGVLRVGHQVAPCVRDPAQALEDLPVVCARRERDDARMLTEEPRLGERVGERCRRTEHPCIGQDAHRATEHGIADSYGFRTVHGAFQPLAHLGMVGRICPKG